MSRVAKSPVAIANGVSVTINGQNVEVKGSKGTLSHTLHPSVQIEQNDGKLNLSPVVEDKLSWAHAGTARALVNNMVTGVSDGFEKKLTLVGVGYRAQAKGKTIDLSLGFSHPVVHELPEGITAETPSATEIVLKGIDKQKVGQTAAEIRAYRPPEPYKGKGVRYSDEHVIRKEAKKK